MDILRGKKPIQVRPKLSFLRVLYLATVLPVVLVFLGLATLIRELFIGGDSVLDLIGRLGDRGKEGLVQRKASKTAVMVALVRYVGSFEGWTDDTISRHFLPYELAKAIQISKMFEPSYPISLKRVGQLMTRTLAGDRLIINGKPKQVVLLGAGLDTRAHRIMVGESCRFYEVDIATTQSLKLRTAKEHPDDFTNRDVRYVAVDFSKENFMEKLVSSSDFDPTCADTVVLFEGVSMYLPWSALEDTMSTLAKGLAKGSVIGMDVIDDIFSSSQARERQPLLARILVRLVKAVGEPFQWGIPFGSTAEEVFVPLGFDLVAEVKREDIERDFLSAGDEVKPFARVPQFWHYLVLRVK